MLTRTVLAALAVAAVAAGGSTTVLVTASGNEHGLAQRSDRATEAQQGKSTEGTQDAQVTEADLPPCPADVKNHGAYVSSVAKANRGHGEEGSEETNHGALVSAAAQSDCGKPEGGDDASVDATESDATKAEKDAAKAARKAEKAERERGKSADAKADAPGQATPTP
jgi:hypothetical protein